MITLSFHIALKIAPSSRSSFCSVSSFTASKGEPDKHVPEAGAWTWETQRCFSMTPVSLSSVSLALPSLNRLTLRRAGVRRQDGADRRECHRTAKHLCSSQRSLLSNNSLASVTSRLGLLHSYRSGAGRVSKRQLVKRVLFETVSSCQWREPADPCLNSLVLTQRKTRGAHEGPGQKSPLWTDKNIHTDSGKGRKTVFNPFIIATANTHLLN